MESIRREPFRLFFLLGALLAGAGALPWVLFGSGVIRVWLGPYHALTMTQGFLLAIAVGFLGTMIPRRTGTPPFSYLELALILAALVAVPLALLGGRLALAEIAYLAALAIVARFAIRRLRAKTSTRPIPPSFVYIPIGLVAGVLGASLLIGFTFRQAAWMLAAGRALAEEGLLLCLVLALTSLLTPIICHDRPAADDPGSSSRRHRLLHAVIGVAILASYALQFAVSTRAGFLTRGVLVAGELLWGAKIHRMPTAPGLHRQLYRVALLFVPLGLLVAGLRPGWRVPVLHLTLVAGLSLLVFAVSFHVTFLHTGREKLARRWPWPVALVGVFTLAAAILRASAERFSDFYTQVLAVAAGLWLAAAAIWAAYLTVLILRPPLEDKA